MEKIEKYEPRVISIHALREEGDTCPAIGWSVPPAFLSTPSARRATKDGTLPSSGFLFLSTPSARRATSHRQPLTAPSSYFYPRPPRGGRRGLPPKDALKVKFLSTPSARRATADHSAYLAGAIFLSTPSARRATLPRWVQKPAGEFLSTPSARRATAKTERKPSAFVSLYTSLHKLQRDVCKPNRKITPLLAQTAGIPVRSVPGNHVCCRFALAGHQKISTLSWANSGCSPTCSTLVW